MLSFKRALRYCAKAVKYECYSFRLKHEINISLSLSFSYFKTSFKFIKNVKFIEIKLNNKFHVKHVNYYDYDNRHYKHDLEHD